jgi:hypothetical protein
MLIKFSQVFFSCPHVLIKKERAKISMEIYSIIGKIWKNWIILFYYVFKSKIITFLKNINRKK